MADGGYAPGCYKSRPKKNEEPPFPTELVWGIKMTRLFEKIRIIKSRFNIKGSNKLDYNLAKHLLLWKWPNSITNTVFLWLYEIQLVIYNKAAKRLRDYYPLIAPTLRRASLRPISAAIKLASSVTGTIARIYRRHLFESGRHVNVKRETSDFRSRNKVILI